MYCDLPFFKRCCFCFPLRPGLIAWGYLKMTAVMIFIALVSVILSDCINAYIHSRTNYLASISVAIFSSIIVVLVIDAIFNFIFILSAHTKNSKLMKTYLCYNIFLFIVSNIAFFLVLGYFVISLCISGFPYIDTVLLCVGMGFINAVLQFYVILLIRSEVKKLDNDCYVMFENNGGRAQCFMTIGKLDVTGVIAQHNHDQTGLLKEAQYDVVT